MGDIIGFRDGFIDPHMGKTWGEDPAWGARQDPACIVVVEGFDKLW